MSKIEWPFFVAHGEEDKICDIGGSKLIYELANSKDKTLKVSLRQVLLYVCTTAVGCCWNLYVLFAWSNIRKVL